MASEVDVCNLALAHLADEAAVSSISPPDGSAQADHCKRFYPIARDALLESFAWPFATNRVALVLTANEPAGAWEYEYAMPSSCARILSINVDGVLDDTTTQDYVIETDSGGNKVILTNTPDAICRFTKLITDTTKYSPLFVTTLSFLLASYLAGPITKSKADADANYRRFLIELAKSSTSAANQMQNNPIHTPQWMAARGITNNPYLAPGRITR